MNAIPTSLVSFLSVFLVTKKTFSIFTTLDVADGQVDADVDVKMADGHAIFKKNLPQHDDSWVTTLLSLSLSLTDSLTLAHSLSLNQCLLLMDFCCHGARFGSSVSILGFQVISETQLNEVVTQDKGMTRNLD